jgi:endoglucanase
MKSNTFILTLRKITFLCFSAVLFIPATSGQIALNQLGFYPKAAKEAIVVNGALVKDFKILNVHTGEIVYTGKLGEPVQSQNSSLTTRIGDFSDFTLPGKYKFVAGQFESAPFEIADHVNQPAAKGVLKGFYYQRVSMPLEEKYAGKWARPAGHPDDVVYIHSSAATKKRPEGAVISAPQGWYDAGDYNKYIVNSGITMGTLLSAYEDFPVYFNQLTVNIPETGNGAADILNEAAYNLRWMLAMQDPYDGGVYNKLTNASFDAMDKKPGETKDPRYVVQKGTAATLDFTAVMAQAARIYKSFPQVYPGLADSCLNAAKKSWEWAVKNPNLAYAQFEMNRTHQPAIFTGGYGDNQFSDEWFWAASELYVTTKDKKYKQVINANINENPKVPTWGDVYMLGVYSLLRSKDGEYDTKFRPALIAMADDLTDAVKTSAFGVVMGKEVSDFMWGSSSQAANQGILLMNAYLLTTDDKYRKAAATNVDYLLGKNATGYSFVTGFGSRPVMNPHHRPSVSDGIEEPVPGLLSGGPNPGAALADRQYYEFTEPETTFADVSGSYASNEIAINWNAPAVYLFNAVEATTPLNLP